MATDVKRERLVLEEQIRDEVVSHLQANLVNLIDLSLQLKQAHWNLLGRGFRSFHLHLDEIIDAAREASDDVAERIATLGVAADGRAGTVAEHSSLDHFPENRLHVEESVTHVADRLESAIRQMRTSIHEIGDSDPISQDMLIGISAGLEKHLWMVQAQEL